MTSSPTRTTTVRRRRTIGLVVAAASMVAGHSGAVAFNAAPADSPPTTGDDGWRQEALDKCEAYVAGFAAIPPPSGTPESLVDYIDAIAALADRVGSFSDIDLPDELTHDPTNVLALDASADLSLIAAQSQAAAGNIEGPEGSATAAGALDVYVAQLTQIPTLFGIAGVPCAGVDPARAASASLNVPVLSGYQIGIGFGSVWVSEAVTQRVNRIDSETGEIIATIDVGSVPVQIQPADGRMIVRATDAFVALDPDNNAVAATLDKDDIGAAADRGYAIDGAMWICDGTRLHRYDPTTLQPVTAIDLDLECGRVHATPELVVAWTYNGEPGESGTSAAAFIDPATNAVLATVELPVDVGEPALLDQIVFFPGDSGPTAVVVDRQGWIVTATPEYGRAMHANSSAVDGSSIYVIVDRQDVLQIDPATLAVTDTIEPFDWGAPNDGVNAIAVNSGALWVANSFAGLLQQLDIANTGL